MRVRITKKHLQTLIAKAEGDWDLLMFLLKEYFKGKGK